MEVNTPGLINRSKTKIAEAANLVNKYTNLFSNPFNIIPPMTVDCIL